MIERPTNPHRLIVLIGADRGQDGPTPLARRTLRVTADGTIARPLTCDHLLAA